MIPDSEDDAFHSGTSLGNSSPPRRTQPQRKPSHSRTRTSRVIQDSEDDGLAGLDLDSSNPPATKHESTMAVKVVIPSTKDTSPSDSCGSSGTRSADGTTGCSTPATSVGTPAESSIKRTRGRVSASDRAQSLRASTITRRASLRGQRGTKRSADAAAHSEDEASPETSDAAIAYALQMEEYEQPPPKKQKTSAPKCSWQTAQTIQEILDASSDSELSQWSLIDKSLNSEDDLDFHSDSDEEERKERDEDEQDDWDTYGREMAAEDEDGLPLSWEEQRKARRVSLKVELDSQAGCLGKFLLQLAKRLTNLASGARRPEEAGEEASGYRYHVGYTEGDSHHHPKSRSAAGLHYSQAQTLPIRRLELDDGAGKDTISRWSSW